MVVGKKNQKEKEVNKNDKPNVSSSGYGQCQTEKNMASAPRLRT